MRGDSFFLPMRPGCTTILHLKLKITSSLAENKVEVS
jgi:hypothetical protein